MTLDEQYTDDDHEFRKDDSYARTKYDITLRWLGGSSPADRTLFHVGCGVGLFNGMAVDAGYRVEAFEPDKRAYDIATTECPPERCAVHLAGLDDVPGEKVADVLVMHDVLEHIDDETGAVAALRRIVNDDGRVILSVPALPSLFGYHDRQLGHYRRYTRRSLQAALAPHFTVRRIRYFGMSFIPITLLFSRILDRAYPTGSVGGKRSLVSRAFDALCRLEGRVALPVGTSLLCEAVPRRG